MAIPSDSLKFSDEEKQIVAAAFESLMRGMKVSQTRVKQPAIAEMYKKELAKAAEVASKVAYGVIRIGMMNIVVRKVLLLVSSVLLLTSGIWRASSRRLLL